MNDPSLAAVLFAIDPAGTGGIAVRGAWGPARDDWLSDLVGLLPEATPMRRLPPAITDERLLGGIDLAATLKAKRPIVERGVLAEADGGVVLLPMAERLAPATVARLTATLDGASVVVERNGIAARHAARLGVIAFDEGIGEDERLSAALGDRLAFHTTLLDGDDAEWTREQVAEARCRLVDVQANDAITAALCEAALALGVVSLRAPLLALRVARAHAALRGAARIEEADAAVAAQLVLAPRATRLPAEPPPPEQPEPPPPDPSEGESPEQSTAKDEPQLTDLILEAARAAIPPNLLASLGTTSSAARSSTAGRTGQLKGGAGRGRPIGTRAGRPGGRAKLSIIETLRAAAPWQGLRGAAGRLEIRVDDFRVTRVKQRSASATIFVVDASGSTAVSRLAEAKGAVELLLADCYVRRDEVALIAFRGAAAEIVLPPTRSLVRAKRSLAGLPGGGGTPLAAAIDMAGAMVRSVMKKGQSPVVVLLTDGKANMTREGKPGAAEAEREAAAAARLFRAVGATALVVDTSPRPRPQSRQLATDMGARYLPLPYAGSQDLSTAIKAATGNDR